MSLKFVRVLFWLMSLVAAGGGVSDGSSDSLTKVSSKMVQVTYKGACNKMGQKH